MGTKGWPWKWKAQSPFGVGNRLFRSSEVGRLRETTQGVIEGGRQGGVQKEGKLAAADS